MDSSGYDTIILGAGGAGLMCALVAGQRGRRVLVVDHASEPGKKILISGGGRCNFTNLHTSADRFISKNRHFAKSALGRYSPADFIQMVEHHNIAWHEKELGQLFCDGSARQIVDMLMDECRRGDVVFQFGEEISAVAHMDGRFRVQVGGRVVAAPSLVIATGGASIPKMGATDFAWDLARQFGLEVVEPRPGLVPLKLGGDDVLFRELSGISANVVVSCNKVRFEGAALFTHRGLSGPAILQISSCWRNGEEIRVNFLPNFAPEWLLAQKKSTPRATLAKALASHLPDRLAKALAEKLGMDAELAANTDKTLRVAGERLANWRFLPTGSEGFAKAEVTIGGIATSELSSRTMEARKVPGLYVIGEAVDVTGWLGGYNFQWAWASGQAAGEVV